MTDPRCPECGGRVGETATYCMHCSAEFPDGPVSGSGGSGGVPTGDATGTRQAEASGGLLDPDGLVDDSLTVVVGVVGGIVVGILGTVLLLVLTGSGWALAFGFVAWMAATGYLVRRQTVQEAVAKSGFAVAGVLLLVPLLALSPVLEVDGGLGERAMAFLVLLVTALIPAAVAASVGWVASRFVPEDGDASVD